MHGESKERRRIIAEMENRQTRIPKHPNPDALRDFKEVPYQLRYGKEKRNKEWRESLLSGYNEYLGTQFTQEDIGNIFDNPELLEV